MNKPVCENCEIEMEWQEDKGYWQCKMCGCSTNRKGCEGKPSYVG